MNTEIGLNWSDYGFRFYDPVVGRFTGVDQISDQLPHLSTFNYASNDPILNIDLHGLQGVPFSYPTNGGNGSRNLAAEAARDKEKMDQFYDTLGFIAGQVLDEIPVVGEAKASYEGGVAELAIGLIPGGRKAKNVVEGVADKVGGAKDVIKVKALKEQKNSRKCLGRQKVVVTLV